MRDSSELFCEWLDSEGFAPACLLPKEDGVVTYHMTRGALNVVVTIADGVLDDPAARSQAVHHFLRAIRPRRVK